MSLNFEIQGLVSKAYEKAFKEPCPFETSSAFVPRMKEWNAAIIRRAGKIFLRCSKRWEKVDEEILLGLAQFLLCRLLKRSVRTRNIELYHLFLQRLGKYAPKRKTCPELEKSFQRVNHRFFNGTMEIPNLSFKQGLRILGTYDYATDTIAITKHLLKDQELLDYVMYHEMLHKKHGISSSSAFCKQHTKNFRKEEGLYPNREELEKRLGRFIFNERRRMKLFKANAGKI